MIIISIETLRNKLKKDWKIIYDWISKLMSTYDHYAIDHNRLEERF